MPIVELVIKKKALPAPAGGTIAMSGGSDVEAIIINGFELPSVCKCSFLIDAGGCNTGKATIEFFVDSISYTDKVENTGFVIMKGKKYRLVPYEEWIAPIEDGTFF